MKTRTVNGTGQEARRLAFTLPELVVVVTVLALLATVALASSRISNAQVLRAHCADNLRQIGIDLGIYATDSRDYLPACRFRAANCWYTYEVGRVFPGTGTFMQGIWNIGELWQTGVAEDPRILYCPAQRLSPFTYDYYATTTNGWPSTPAGSGDDNVRAGFTYFPQLRQTELIGFGIIVPKVQSSSSDSSFVTPAKMTELNPLKSMTTDLVHDLSVSPHRSGGELEGLNALFPDGAVVFQNARTEPAPFDPRLWASIGNNGREFRFVNNSWHK